MFGKVYERELPVGAAVETEYLVLLLRACCQQYHGRLYARIPSGAQSVKPAYLRQHNIEQHKIVNVDEPEGSIIADDISSVSVVTSNGRAFNGETSGDVTVN